MKRLGRSCGVGVGLASALLGACAAIPPVPEEQRTLFRSVTVIPMDQPGTVAGRDVLVTGGRIHRIAPAGSIRPRGGDQVIDGRGRYLMPGLWDMHAHATRPEGEASASLPLYLSYGVVGVREMGATLPDLRTLRASARDGSASPEIVAAGPVLDGPRRPWQQKVAMPLADVEAVHRAVTELKAEGVAFLKPYDGLSREQYQALVDAGRAAGLPLAGHVPMRLTLEDVSAAGQRSVEHVNLKTVEGCTPDGARAVPAMLNAWISAGFAGKYREISSWAPRRRMAECRTLYARLAERGTWLTPTLSLEFLGDGWTTQADLDELSPPARATCETDLTAVAAAPAAERTAALRHFLDITRELHEAGVPLLAGSDVPNSCLSHGRSLHKELRLLKAAGLSEWEVLRTATVNPARFLGRADEGVVRPGAAANLLLLHANPLQDIANTSRIDGVMVRGRWRDRSALTELRSRALLSR